MDLVFALSILWEQGEYRSMFELPWCRWGVARGLGPWSGRMGGIMSV